MKKKSPTKKTPNKNQTTPKKISTPKSSSKKRKENEMISPRNVLGRNAKKSLKYTEIEDEKNEKDKNDRIIEEDEYNDMKEYKKQKNP